MSDLSMVLDSLWMGLPILLGHMLLTVVIWIVTLAFAFWITPYQQLRGVRSGNVAVAISAGGFALGTAIPLAFCLSGAANAWDIVVWALPVMLMQLAAFWVTSLLIPNLPERLDKGDVAAAVALFLFRMGFACINAAAIAA